MEPSAKSSGAADGPIQETGGTANTWRRNYVSSLTQSWELLLWPEEGILALVSCTSGCKCRVMSSIMNIWDIKYAKYIFKFLFNLSLCLFKDISGAKDGLTGFSCSDNYWVLMQTCITDMTIGKYWWPH